MKPTLASDVLGGIKKALKQLKILFKTTSGTASGCLRRHNMVVVEDVPQIGATV